MATLRCQHCRRPAVTKSRQMCRMHDTRWQRHGDPNVVFNVQPHSDMRNTRRIERPPCRECDRPPVGRGLCVMHYQRWYRSAR